MDQVKIGQFIGICRREKNLTQRQLADLVGVSDKAVSKWENGKREPGINQLITLAKFFKCTTDYLLGLE